MLPRPRCFIPGSTAATSRYVAIRFSSTAATKSSSRISSTNCGRLGDPPALATRTSVPPNPASASRTTSATCTASVRSPTTALQVPPSASIAAHTAANASVSRPCTLTRAPWRARWIAITRPMPRDAPVTSTCRPASSEPSAIILPPVRGSLYWIATSCHQVCLPSYTLRTRNGPTMLSPWNRHRERSRPQRAARSSGTVTSVSPPRAAPLAGARVVAVGPLLPADPEPRGSRDPAAPIPPRQRFAVPSPRSITCRCADDRSVARRLIRTDQIQPPLNGRRTAQSG